MEPTPSNKKEEKSILSFLNDSPNIFNSTNLKLDHTGWVVTDSFKNDSNSNSFEHKLSPKSSRREQNKHYAKLNRRRKKEYTIELEQKVEKLEKEVKRLNDEILILK